MADQVTSLNVELSLIFSLISLMSCISAGEGVLEEEAQGNVLKPLRTKQVQKQQNKYNKITKHLLTLFTLQHPIACEQIHPLVPV